MMINTITIAIILFSPGVFLGMQTEATVTLTAQSSPPCFGQTYKLTCTHPVLDADTLVRWERNGTGFGTSASTTHDEVDPTPTTTTLTITVTREEFKNKVYTYRCITFDLNVGLSDPNRTISNKITVDPPEMPLSVSNVTYSKTNDSISLNWQHDDVCFDPITYEIEVQNDVKTVLTVNTTNHNITIKELVPKTKYTIAIRAVNGTVKSEPYPLMITTLENVKLEQTGTDGNKTELTCKHHDRNDKAFNSTSTFWKKNDDKFVKYNDEFVKRQNKQTTLSIAAKDGDIFVCALQLKSGGMEKSNMVTIQSLKPSVNVVSDNSPPVVEIAVPVVTAILIIAIAIASAVIFGCIKRRQGKHSNAVTNEESVQGIYNSLENGQNKVNNNCQTGNTQYAEVFVGQKVEGNGSKGGSFNATFPTHLPNEMLDVIYNEPCRCCTNGCAAQQKSKECKVCDGASLSDTVLPCGHTVCSVTAKTTTECPFCSYKVEPETTVLVVTVSLPEKEKKHFCKKCAEVCLISLCQKCFRPDRPVAFAPVCGHQVCETCRAEEEKCTYCNEEKMIKLI